MPKALVVKTAVLSDVAEEATVLGAGVVVFRVCSASTSLLSLVAALRVLSGVHDHILILIAVTFCKVHSLVSMEPKSGFPLSTGLEIFGMYIYSLYI